MAFPVNTPDGLFHDGNPATNTPGTIVDAAWLNAVQAAIIALGTMVTTVSATYPVTNNDGVIFCDTTGGGFTVTLPVTAGQVAGKRFVLKNIGANTLSIVAADAKTIDGSLQVDLVATGEIITVCYDGVNWQTI